MIQLLRPFRKTLILLPLVFAGIAVLIAVLVLWRRRHGLTDRDALATSVLDGLTVLAMAGPLALTLVPSGGLTGRSLDWIPLRSAWDQLTSPVDARSAAVQLAGNLFLLLPFGFLVPMRWPVLDGVWRILCATVLFGVLIEGLQFAMGFGRQASTSDLALYVVGGLVGYRVSRAARSLFATNEAANRAAS